MLSLPLTELRQRVEQELLLNPALEEVSEGEEEDRKEEDALEAGDRDGEDADDAVPESDPDPMTEIEVEDFYAEHRDNTGGLALREDPPTLERTLAAGKTLSQHLIEQLGPSVRNERERAIGLRIIGNLDERGYLDATVAEIAADLEVPEVEVEAMRARILRFDPTGSACLDLAECLLAQLESLDEDTGPLETIVREHLDLVLGERFRELARAMELEVSSLMRLVRRLGELEMRPGSRFVAAREQVVIPDARAYRFNGTWRVGDERCGAAAAGERGLPAGPDGAGETHPGRTGVRPATPGCGRRVSSARCGSARRRCGWWRRTSCANRRRS